MDIRTLSLILLALSCTSSEAPVVATTPTVVVSTAPKRETWPPPDWFPRTNMEAAQLQAHIAKKLDDVTAKVAAYDPALAQELKSHVSEFRTLTPAVIVDNAPDGTPIFEPYDCPKKCDLFLAEDLDAVATWHNNFGWMVFNYRAINDGYTGLIGFHELFHRWEVEGQQIKTAEKMPGLPNPWETNAWNYQSRIANAVTGGRYSVLLDGWRKGVQAGLYPSVVTSNVTIAAVPEEFKKLFAQLGSNSQLSCQGFSMMFEYDLNRRLIETFKLSDEEKKRELALVYNRIVASMGDKRAQDIVRNSMLHWLK